MGNHYCFAVKIKNRKTNSKNSRERKVLNQTKPAKQKITRGLTDDTGPWYVEYHAY